MPAAAAGLPLGLELGLVVFLALVAAAVSVWNTCLRRTLRKRIRADGHDSLTGLPVRVLVNDRISRAIESDSGGVAVLLIDLDRFKSINNNYGREAGDALLRQLGLRLRDVIGAPDTVARVGGDEFVVVLAGGITAESAASTAMRVLSHVRAPFAVDGHVVHCTATVGIALHPGDGSTAEGLMRHADMAMELAKAKGRNGFEFFRPEMGDQATERLHLENALRGALARGEFVLHYQPRLEVRTATVTSFEALLRWRHPDRGLVGPDEFMPVLEESDFIAEVGAWVLDTACAQIRRWADEGRHAARVAVNISARQLERPGLNTLVSSLLHRYAIDPSLLELELTESVLMHDAGAAAETLRRLGDMGVHLAIDDFGTGYAGFAYLRRFPVHTLKVDRAFLADTDAAEAAAMTRAIVDLGHALGLRVVAEGVEKPSQLQLLRELRCDEMQGFLFGPGLPAADVDGWCERMQK